MGIHRSDIQQLDTTAFLWMQQHFVKNQTMPLVRAISFTGDGWLYVVIAALIVLTESDNYLTFFYSSLFGYAVQVPAYLMLKQKFKRDRPQAFLGYFQAKIQPADQFSFPSGHTAAAFVMAIQLLIFYPIFGVLALIWASAIGLSRILLGVHFPGDIIAGILLGSLSSLVANNVIQPIFAQ